MTGEKTDHKGMLSARLSRPAWRYALIAAGCALLTLIFYISYLYGRSIPEPYFVPLHLTLELSSIVVSFAVFAIGWYGYRQTGSVRDLIIGTGFGATAALDLVHALSYRGMPDFLAINNPGRAAAFWLVGRLIVGVGLLGAALTGPALKADKLWPRCLICTAGAVVAASIVLFSIYGEEVGHALYPRIGQPPSALKNVLEVGIIALYALVFALVSEKRGWSRDVVMPLRSALIVAVFAEISLTLYLSPYGWMNLLGHVFKTAAYYLILNALFVTAVKRPYEELSQAKDELQSLYLDAREHRREIEQSFGRVGSALSSSLKPEAALDLIAQLAAEMHHVDCSVVVSLDKTGKAVQVAAQRGGCHKAERPVEVALLAGEQAIEQGGTATVNDLQSTGWIDCDFTEHNCLRSVVAAPMRHEGAVLGVVAVFSHSKFAFEDGDAAMLEGFAAHAAIAMHNALSYERESRIADVLQKALLGTPNLRAERFEIAQVYQPATDEALVGGDFYDVFEVPDGRVGLLIGDVSGKGLAAAVHTAMVKYSLRAYANEGHSPAEAVRYLNAIVSRYMNCEAFVTLFYGLLDPHTGELRYANAGHEPPIYMRDGTGLTLPSTGPAVGAGIDLEYEEGTLKMERGSILLLYTDGISEARHDGEFLGTDGITKKLVACDGLASEGIARCIHRSAVEFAGGELKDDAAVLAVRALW